MITEDDKKKYWAQAHAGIIAVDYDNTITKYRPYPELAPLDKKAKKYLDKLHEKGFTLILWSCRIKEDYDAAYDRCINEFDMPYMLKDSDKYIHGKTGKLIAGYYIDELSSYGKVNWRKTYKYIIKNVKKVLKN